MSDCLHCGKTVTRVGGLLAISQAEWRAGDRAHARDWCPGLLTGEHETAKIRVCRCGKTVLAGPGVPAGTTCPRGC